MNSIEALMNLKHQLGDPIGLFAKANFKTAKAAAPVLEISLPTAQKIMRSEFDHVSVDMLVKISVNLGIDFNIKSSDLDSTDNEVNDNANFKPKMNLKDIKKCKTTNQK